MYSSPILIAATECHPICTFARHWKIRCQSFRFPKWRCWVKKVGCVPRWLCFSSDDFRQWYSLRMEIPKGWAPTEEKRWFELRISTLIEKIKKIHGNKLIMPDGRSSGFIGSKGALAKSIGRKLLFNTPARSSWRSHTSTGCNSIQARLADIWKWFIKMNSRSFFSGLYRIWAYPNYLSGIISHPIAVSISDSPTHQNHHNRARNEIYPFLFILFISYFPIYEIQNWMQNHNKKARLKSPSSRTENPLYCPEFRPPTIQPTKYCVFFSKYFHCSDVNEMFIWYYYLMECLTTFAHQSLGASSCYGEYERFGLVISTECILLSFNRNNNH